MGLKENNDAECQKKIGSVLRQLRFELGYKSYETFASDFGLARMQYWRMEYGETNFTIKSLNKVAAIHKVKLAEIFKRAMV